MPDREKLHLPAGALDALARQLFPVISAYFESEEGKAAFAEWKSQVVAETSSKPTEVILRKAG
jgi:hypothetical protein